MSLLSCWLFYIEH